MNRILGIDLGTNSIGLTLREGDEFIWYGVYIFRKGVGEGKSGEFSFAAERTKHRSSRRLYNSRRYRKWETLKVLIENDYCPLPIEKLNDWKHYKKGMGRVYPVDDVAFSVWIKLDFDGDGIPDYTSPYKLRKELISEKFDLKIPKNRYKVGRALYHIAQRRGFKSSRKSGANEKTAVYKGSNETKTIGRNEYENLIVENGSLGAAFAFLEDQGLRVRNRYTLRSDYQTEVVKILDCQGISDTNFKGNIQKAIFFQRPLRSQKGLIGKCTLEPNKSRCSISHPKYEEYRAWSFINNIKYRTKSDAQFEPLPLSLKEKLYNDKFFLKSRDFEFSQIRKFIKIHGGKDWELNYTYKMDDISVSACPVSARLKSVFGDDWQKFEKSVIRKNKQGKDELITYKIDDVWHILSSFEDEEYFEEFLVTILELNEEQIKELKILFNSFPVGYANLSLKAINSILPFLREGLIYSESVILAKIPEILGNGLFVKDKANILEGIRNVIKENREEKTSITIANNLIFKYYALDNIVKFGWKDTSYQLVESDLKDIETAAKEHFGEKTWDVKDKGYKQMLIQNVTQKYQKFFMSHKREHIKPPHLVKQVKQFIADNFEVNTKNLDRIYHPSQIAIYPKKEEQEYLLSPKTAAFKNPMAYKTLYKLRDVINYLIETGKIDEETRIVIEIARELNDSNKRWAIEKHQRDREIENRSFAAAIGELLKEKSFKGLADPHSDSDVDKLRIWTEQLEQFDEVKKEISSIENNKKLSVSEKDIQKYRLWKEQNCRCMYTGKIISLTDLFDINKIDFEHTIPRSKSFDNSLANLTVCYADYNRSIKNNQLPIDLPNYDTESHGYSAIKPRLEAWEKRVDELYKQIDFWKMKSKMAMDKPTKDDAIRQRHLRHMEYDYWKNKLDRFTRKEVPTGFVNSQLVDTQIITKYALHYLKTVFDKIDVIKGSITAEFRKIYEIQPKNEIKDRSRHSHHTIDAAVLTLIPSPRKREEILKKTYEFEEQNKKRTYHEKPFPSFKYTMIEEIEKNILINNIAEKDNVLAPGKKIVRKRGRIVWLNKEKKIPKVASGDSVRGELHLQTNYGKIKIASKNDKGTILKDDKGNILYNQVDGKDEIWMVLRKPIEKVNFISDLIIDGHLGEYLKQQLKNGNKQNELKDFQGKKLRHLRCRVKAARGFMNPNNATIVKEQVYKSSKEYKNYIYADSGGNYLFGLYENEFGRTIVSLNIFESSAYARHIEGWSYEGLFKPKEPIYIGRAKNKDIAKLYHVFIVGQKVLFYSESKGELLDLDKNDLSNRLYFVKNLADAKQGLIRFQHHLDARDDKQLSEDFPEKNFGKKGMNGFSKFSTNFIAPRLLLSPSNFDFIIEGKDFEMKLDGSIEFKFKV
jgi:CRISPR-associated endonuclease Csn1